MEIKIDLENSDDETFILEKIGDTLKFADYYGVNWDAMDECIHFMDEGAGMKEGIKYEFPLQLIFTNFKKFKLKKTDQFKILKDVLDTAVKHYSSGMYVRLAFSVAVHLDWDILLLDEVLAVGDEEFQKKSYEKISSLINSDKTVVLASHNLEMVKKLCTKVILLNNGSIQKVGRANSVVDYYLKNVKE